MHEGVRHWTARHPDWTPESTGGWGPDVTSYAIDAGELLLLIDPLAPPRDVTELAARRETAIVLTNPWHERDARRLSAELGAPVFVPEPEEGEPISGRTSYSTGDRLRGVVEACAGREPNDLVLWIESRRALVVGDTLIDRGAGLELPTDWLPDGVTREQMLDVLRPLLELPVELVLPTHGAPTDRAALERALAA